MATKRTYRPRKVKKQLSLKERLRRSQVAHDRLASKYQKQYLQKDNDPIAHTKATYHNAVFVHQDEQNRILNSEEKRHVFQRAKSAFITKKPSKRSPNKDGYSKMIRDMEDRKRDFFSDDFERDSKGRIKGHYTVDGFFEPGLIEKSRI